MKDPGSMTERITLQAPVQGKGAMGGATLTWQPLRTVWARKLTEKGVEAFAGNRLVGKVEIGFAIRYWPGHPLDQRHSFTYQGRHFNISSVVESERRTELVLLGTAGANLG